MFLDFYLSVAPIVVSWVWLGLKDQVKIENLLYGMQKVRGHVVYKKEANLLCLLML